MGNEAPVRSRDLKTNNIVIVSGLPRSGTSMMMQMLAAGGIPALTDGIRQPDGNNPKGYYELEAVKQTKQDASWLDQARGKCVKVVSLLLYDLPDDRQYHIIFMTRSMDEVLASQAAMLKVRGKENNRTDDDMREYFATHLARLERRLAEKDNMNVLYCDHRELINHPEQQAHIIAGFLDCDLDIQAMVAVIDPSLHRQRKD